MPPAISTAVQALARGRGCWMKWKNGYRSTRQCLADIVFNTSKLFSKVADTK
jgi:hypothetical protein